MIGFRSKSDARRVIEAVKRFERERAATGTGLNRDQSAETALVKITGAAVDGLQPADVIGVDPDTGAETVIGEVRYRDLNGVELALGKVVLARLNGQETTDQFGVYVGGDGGGDGGFWALLIAEVVGPPCEYEWRRLTRPSQGTPSGPNADHTLELGEETGYAFEVRNRKCDVVPDPGTGTMTPVSPWDYAVVWVRPGDGGHYFAVDQTAQDDRPGLVSPTDQRWEDGRKTIEEGFYAHESKRVEANSWDTANDADFDDTVTAFVEADGVRNSDGQAADTPLVQIGIAGRVANFGGGGDDRFRSSQFVELTDDYAEFPLWHAYEIGSDGTPKYASDGMGHYAYELWESGTRDRTLYTGPGFVAVTDGVKTDGRYRNGAGLAALGTTRFPAEGSTFNSGPMCIVGASGMDALGMILTTPPRTWDYADGDSPTSSVAGAPGLYRDACEHVTGSLMLRGAGATDIDTEDGRFGVTRWFDGNPYAVWGGDFDFEVVVPFPASVSWPTGATTKYTLEIRGGIAPRWKVTTTAGIPVPPPDEV